MIQKVINSCGILSIFATMWVQKKEVNMQNIDQLIHARWVLPIAPINTVLEQHSIAIKNDKILAILPTDQALAQYKAKDTHHLEQHAVMPGLVNGHTHLAMNLFRGLADDLALMDWLQNYIWPAEGDVICAESVSAGTRLAIAEMLRGGTTCFNDHYFFPDIIAQAAIDLGMRAMVGLEIMNVPTGYAQKEQEYLDKALATLENGPHHPLINYAWAPGHPFTVSNDFFKKIKILSDEREMPIHIHVHETIDELNGSLEQHGCHPLERLDQLGLLSPNLISVHMVHVTDSEIELVAKKGVHVIHCPESNLKLASGFAPITKYLAAGVNVALGTDGAASNNDLDMFGELKTAAFLAKAVSSDPTAVPAAEALKMATLNGARALGLDNKIGSLEPNKQADVIAVDLSSYITQPIYNPMSHLAYAANRLQVSDVWVAGKHLLSKHEFLDLNTNALIVQVQDWASKAERYKSAASSIEKAEA